MAKFWDSDVSDMVNTDDFADTITCASPSLSFSGIFDYVYGEDFGFGDREVPSVTAKTADVTTLSQDDVVTVPASAFDDSSSSKTFKILVKKEDNTGITILILESN